MSGGAVSCVVGEGGGVKGSSFSRVATKMNVARRLMLRVMLKISICDKNRGEVLAINLICCYN